MTETRAYWLEQMLKIAKPVIWNLAEDRLKATIPLDFHEERKDFVLLEAFARTLCGMAPWLELEGLSGEEAVRQAKWREKVRAALWHATDPESADYMNFGRGEQPLVDCGFLAHAVIRAPKQLYETLEPELQENLKAALRLSRPIKPYPTNWLFFSAIVEAALFRMGDNDYEKQRMDHAVSCFEDWYLGDGVYGDGADFHFDYYNSFVIHPMYVDLLQVMQEEDERYAALLPEVRRRASRYAAILERMIAPDASYPVLGRSLAYRFGNFQLLGQAALQDFLPEGLSPGQVRTALTAVIRRVLEAEEEIFDDAGFLRPGIYGEQPELAEGYINIGSLYLCETAFLPLGLGPETAFWTDPSEDWTNKKVWSGGHVAIDAALE